MPTLAPLVCGAVAALVTGAGAVYYAQERRWSWALWLFVLCAACVVAAVYRIAACGFDPGCDLPPLILVPAGRPA